MSLLRIAAVLTFAATLPAVADARVQDQPAKPAKAAKVDTNTDPVTGEKLICRRLDPAVGEIRGERVCKTAAQWDAKGDIAAGTYQRENARTFLEQTQIVIDAGADMRPGAAMRLPGN